MEGMRRIALLAVISVGVLSAWAPGRAEDPPETAPIDGGAETSEAPVTDSASPVGEEAESSPAPEAEPTPTPTPTEAAVEETPKPEPEERGEALAATSRARFDPRIPLYTQLRPHWGVEVTTSLDALGEGAAIPGQSDSKVRATSISLEWQPAFLQSYGVLAMGPMFNVYLTIPKTGLFTTAIGMWSLGGQIRYEARYLREQPLVPVVGYGVESVGYNLSSGPSGRFLARGPVLGGMVLLNFMDPGAAAEFYVNHGVTRSYAVAEYRSNEGTDGTVTLAGRTLFFGLRFEY